MFDFGMTIIQKENGILLQNSEKIIWLEFYRFLLVFCIIIFNIIYLARQLIDKIINLKNILISFLNGIFSGCTTCIIFLFHPYTNFHPFVRRAHQILLIELHY